MQRHLLVYRLSTHKHKPCYDDDMQKFTQKYAIIQLLEVMEEGSEYLSSNWPLHVTIGDTFAVDWENNNLFNKLSELLTMKKPVISKAGDDDYFGPQKQTQVTLLEMNQELTALHRDVVSLLKRFGAVFNDPQYINDGFIAHATVQSRARLQPGDTVSFDRLTIIDMFPGSDPYRRKVLKSIKLLGK